MGVFAAPLLGDEVAFDRDLHAYLDQDNVRRMSVTQALTISGLVDYSMVPEPVLRIAQQRGRLVHHAAAVIDRGDALDEFDVPAEIEPYIEGYHAFMREMKFVPDADWIERPMIVELFGQRVGMTPDAVGTIHGVPTLIERKTCASYHPAWAIQTAGYELGLTAAGLQIRQRFAVQLAFETTGGPPRGVRYNAHASVILYTGESPIANALAWLWIRLIAVLTYVS